MRNPATLNNNISSWRILTIGFILLLVFVVYIGRLFSLQVIQYQSWLDLADDNRTHEINLQASRGIIYDRNGIILAQNIPSYHVVITPANLPDDEGEIQEIYQALSKLTGIPVTRSSLEVPYVPCVSDHGIAQIVEDGATTAPYDVVRVACDVSRQIALVVEENREKWPGAGVFIEPIRDYPTGSLTASIIGFLGPIPATSEDYYRAIGYVPNRDKVGYAGVELYFQDELSGRNGLRVVEWDVAGKILRDLEAPIQPTAGSNIVLTLDTRLQHAVEAILMDEINDWSLYFGEQTMTSAAVIAIDPRTGVPRRHSYGGALPSSHQVAPEVPFCPSLPTRKC